MIEHPSPEKLALCPLFGGLDAERCRLFCARLVRIEIAPGDLVYEEGDPAHEMYVVVEGKLEVFKPSRSIDLPLTELVPGDFFGDMSFIDMQPRSATVRAADHTALWKLSYGELRKTYEQDLKCYTLVVMNIARELSRRLRRADRIWTPSTGDPIR